ncbi:chaperonin-60kD, ch60 [Dorcoceras hygrometricum]|uniref:Chaperonin-60kD, ch60 n=1 Tax=Dorcoceras hygrometricum TaxID=472368 RepID=A0A2Z7CPZ2_9LAMI|nr:chaperonin-60kD, ch60 [Dorcoceras hygrometricum]
MLEQVANATNEVAGDGTTCATVLTQAIIAKGYKSVAAGMKAMDLRRGISMAVDAVVTNVKSRTTIISTSEEITQVGTISANGEREIGELIAKAMEKVGKEGVITIQDGKTWFNELEVGEGMKLDSEPNLQNLVGSVDNLENLEFDEFDCLGEIDQYHDAALFVSETGHGESGEISQPQGNYYDNVGMDPVTSSFLNNLENGRVNYQWTDEQRCATFTATEANQMLTEELGMYLEEVNLDMLGSCKKVSISKDDKEKLQERLAKLSDGVAANAQFPHFNLGDKVASKSGGIVMGQTTENPNKRARPIITQVDSRRKKAARGEETKSGYKAYDRQLEGHPEIYSHTDTSIELGKVNGAPYLRECLFLFKFLTCNSFEVIFIS